MSKSLCERLLAARRVSVPLVAIETADPAATIALFRGEAFAAVGSTATVLVSWDVINGFLPLNEAGRQALSQISEAEGVIDPVAALIVAQQLPAGSVLVFHNAHRFMDGVPVVQGVWNLRDKYKSNFRMLVLLAPVWKLPVELQADVVVVDHPLPSAEEISAQVAKIVKAAKLGGGVPDGAVDALRGLTAFQAEQQAAMAARKTGIDVDDLWESKRKLVEQTPGLSIEGGSSGFDSIGGVPVVKSFIKSVLTGNRKPKAIVFIDEIEKALAGVGGDTSGVSQDQLGALLSYMQDNRSTGCLFIGPPGAAKSVVAKAAGAECGIPTVKLDLGATKGGLVGQSEEQLRKALKTISAVSDGNALWIATCNSIGVLPPELRRRFTLGTFFFDLPDAEERKAIWEIYRKRYSLKGALPEDAGWTGAEIERACDIADRLGVSLKEAANFIVPVSRAAADQINALRASASGKFLSASHPGVFVAAQSFQPDSLREGARQIAV